MYANMTLEDLIAWLERQDQDLIVQDGFGSPHSDRGSYDELAFSPLAEARIGDMLAHARSAVGATFHGWKGGEYKMELHTSVHIGEYGECGDAITPTHFKYWLLTGQKTPPPASQSPKCDEHHWIEWGMGVRKCQRCGTTEGPGTASQSAPSDGGGPEPGEPAPPPSTPAQHYLASVNGVATQEWQDGFNEASRLATAGQPGSAVQGEAVGYVDGSRLHELREGRLNVALWAERSRAADTPLYTTPPPAPVAEQLTPGGTVDPLEAAIATHSDDELPGMWERGDFISGKPEARGVEGMGVFAPSAAYIPTALPIEAGAKVEWDGTHFVFSRWHFDGKGHAASKLMFVDAVLNHIRSKCEELATTPNPVRAEQPSSTVQADPERVAQLIAHRACHSAEHDPQNGRLHGYCVVCGVPWPCEYAGTPPLASAPAAPVGVDEAMVERACEEYLQEAKRQGFAPSEAWARSQQAKDWMRAALAAALAGKDSDHD